MFVLIADSGSTKTDWVLLQKGRIVKRLKTIGFNPYFQTKDQISLEVLNHLKPFLTEEIGHISTLHYYGTGCSTAENCLLIEDCMRLTLDVFDVRVSHDLLGAARALCKDQPGIAGILGTGSNSCLYDGRGIVENVPSTGYLWSDYGGGSQIGKYFIKEYFEDTLPADLRQAFEAEGYNREVILNNVYKNGVPGKYLASVSRFVGRHREHPFARRVLLSCFDSFFVQQVNKYSDSRKYAVHTVGSVGFYYKDLIAESAAAHGYRIGTVLQSPMEGLIDYHS